MHRARRERLRSWIRHADDGDVGLEELHHGLGDRCERRVEREALCERLRDGVETPQLAGGAALGDERALEDLGELLRLLVETCVLDCNGELARKRQQQPFLSVPVRARTLLEDAERSDRLVVDQQRHEERPAHAARLDRLLEAGQPRVVPEILDEEEAAAPVRAERKLEEPLGQFRVRPAQATRGRRDEATLFAEVDGDLPARCQLGDALDRRVERVGKRKLRDGLADDGDERLRALESRLGLGGPPTAPERERRAGSERGEAVEPRLDPCIRRRTRAAARPKAARPAEACGAATSRREPGPAHRLRGSA